MSRNTVATQKLEPTGRTRALNRALWRQVSLNVGYVLIAGPRGLMYLLLLTLGLALDLPYLTLRLLLAGVLSLLYATVRSIPWVLRYCLRVLWSGSIAILLWTIQTSWWLLAATLSATVHLLSSLLFGLLHPHRAWRRAIYRTRREQVPRPVRTARIKAVAAPRRGRGIRFFEARAAGLNSLRRQVVPDRWIVVPTICWQLALWERHHTMRLLNIDLPTPGSPIYISTDQMPVRSPPPLASLGYLIAKVPIGALALSLVVLTINTGAWLAHIGFIVAAPVVALVTLYLLHVLAYVSGRFAYRAFSPSAAMRRLHAAEAMAAQERSKAEQAERSRRDLIINVGHELRTPTASILGHVESLLLAADTPNGQIAPDTLKTYLGIVQREALRLSSLVDDLLAVARAERDELHLVVAPIDAAEVIHEVYQALAPLARRERQVMLVHEVQPNVPLLLADRQRLSQVLLNLVRNAITYTPPGGIVSIALRHIHHDQMLITVADTGSGIAPADLERVFERFFRADASRTRASGGFGLGLAIARDLVQAMGGTITAESVVGEGSSFHVRLPAAANNFG